MSAMSKSVPVVTYKLLPEWERQLNNRFVAKKARAAARTEEASLLKTKLENEKHLAEKKAIREEIKRTHVIPVSFLVEKRAKKEEQKKAQEFALIEQRRQKSLAEDILREEREQYYQAKQFKRELRLAKVVPIEVKNFPEMFKKNMIGEVELIECEEVMIPFLTKLAKIAGFTVEIDEFEGKIALLLQKPYPYWKYAFSGAKMDALRK